MKCEAAGSRLTAPSQWATRCGSVISPKSLFFRLTDKFTRVTVFTARGDSSSMQNQDPLRKIRGGDAVTLLVEEWTHKHERLDWDVDGTVDGLKIWHRCVDWQSSANCSATKKESPLLLQGVFLGEVLHCSLGWLIGAITTSLLTKWLRNIASSKWGQSLKQKRLCCGIGSQKVTLWLCMIDYKRKEKIKICNLFVPMRQSKRHYAWNIFEILEKMLQTWVSVFTISVVFFFIYCPSTTNP